MKLLILTPEETLLEADDVARVRLPLADGGSVGIHPGHHPLLAETRAGRVEYGEEEYQEAVSVRAGILHVEADRVMIYTSGWAGEAEGEAAESPDVLEEALRGLEQELEGEG